MKLNQQMLQQFMSLRIFTVIQSDACRIIFYVVIKYSRFVKLYRI